MTEATEQNNPHETAVEQPGFWRQVYRHRLSLLSLFIAITSLGYNTWRNEATEAHRNTREAAFHILLDLGELEQIVSYRHYFYSRADEEELASYEDGDWVRGWGKVALINDLSQILPERITIASKQLQSTWQNQAAMLELGPRVEAGRLAEQQLDDSIETVRQAVLETLNSLE